jgi:hypothetical protein
MCGILKKWQTLAECDDRTTPGELAHARTRWKIPIKEINPDAWAGLGNFDRLAGSKDDLDAGSGIDYVALLTISIRRIVWAAPL